MDPVSNRMFWLIYLASILGAIAYISLNFGPKATNVSATVGALAIVGLILVGVFKGMLLLVRRRLTKTVAFPQRFRPGAAIIPGFTTRAMGEVSRGARWGSTGGRYYGEGGRPVAVVVLPDRIEVWSGRNNEPRLTFSRTQFHTIGVTPGSYGLQTVPCATVANSTDIVLQFVPVYRPSVFRDSSAESLERAMRTLMGQ